MKRPELRRSGNLERALLVRNHHRNCFYQYRYRRTSTLPQTRNDDKVFRLRNQFVRDTALSRRETERIRFANSGSYENTVYSRTLASETNARSGMNGVSASLLRTVSYPTFTGRRAYVSADADGDGFARLDKDETSLCQPSASNKMASFVAALRISTCHDSAFLTLVWSVSLLAFENFAKFVSRNSALQFVEITHSAKCANVAKMLKSIILIAVINDQILVILVCNLREKKKEE